MKAYWIIILVIGLAVIIGGAYILQSKNSKSNEGLQENGNQDDTQSPATNNAQQPSSQAQSIKISGFSFNPLELKIKRGDTITWVNEDSVRHTVTSDSGSELDSKLFGQGETYSHTFNEAGTFDYHCSPHPGMKARIIVE